MPKSNVQSAIEELAQAFARDVLSVLAGAVNQLAGTNGGAAGVRTAARVGAGPGGRRSQAETAAVARRIAEYVKGQPKGVRVDAIGAELKMTTSALALPIKKALATKAIRRTGERRAMRYLPAK